MRTLLLGITCVLAAAAQDPQAPTTWQLELREEVECATLYGPGVYEASGLVLAEGKLHLVFDNLAQVGSVSPNLDPSSGTLSAGRAGFSDYEAIAYDEQERCFYVAIEAEEIGREAWRPRIVRLDASGAQTGSWQIERELHSSNKGVEGLTFVRRGGKGYLLALLEGNHGSSSDRGRDTGNGRLLVLAQQATGGWAIERELELPKTADFVDYAGLDVRGGQIAVVSQTSSALWIGTIKPDWTLSSGRTYPLPRQADGSLKFGRVEGVAWLSKTRLAMCSDQERPRDRGLGRAEQALHVFELTHSNPQQAGASSSDGLSGSLGRN